MLFVGLPVLLAAALALAPVRSTHGRVFLATTVCLLLAAVLLREGVICVVLAAPLVYAVAHGTTALINYCLRADRAAHAVVLVPLLLAGGIEGSSEDLRIAPEQSVEVVRLLALSTDEVSARVVRGPRPVPARSIPLRLLGVPLPGEVSGSGLAAADRWVFAYHGTSHGPGGHLVAEVTRSEPGRVEFGFVEDTSITGRWLTWRHAALSWHAVDDRHTEVRLSVSYRRGLDPSWYFGPIQDGLVHEGAAHLLDMMALS
jgi:hypothetical protein